MGEQRTDAEILDPVMSEFAFDTSNDTSKGNSDMTPQSECKK